MPQCSLCFKSEEAVGSFLRCADHGQCPVYTHARCLAKHVYTKHAPDISGVYDDRAAKCPCGARYLVPQAIRIEKKLLEVEGHEKAAAASTLTLVSIALSYLESRYCGMSGYLPYLFLIMGFMEFLVEQLDKMHHGSLGYFVAESSIAMVVCQLCIRTSLWTRHHLPTFSQDERWSPVFATMDMLAYFIIGGTICVKMQHRLTKAMALELCAFSFYLIDNTNLTYVDQVEILGMHLAATALVLRVYHLHLGERYRAEYSFRTPADTPV